MTIAKHLIAIDAELDRQMLISLEWKERSRVFIAKHRSLGREFTMDESDDIRDAFYKKACHEQEDIFELCSMLSALRKKHTRM